MFPAIGRPRGPVDGYERLHWDRDPAAAGGSGALALNLSPATYNSAAPGLPAGRRLQLSESASGLSNRLKQSELRPHGSDPRAAASGALVRVTLPPSTRSNEVRVAASRA